MPGASGNQKRVSDSPEVVFYCSLNCVGKHNPVQCSLLSHSGLCFFFFFGYMSESLLASGVEMSDDNIFCNSYRFLVFHLLIFVFVSF